jgi:uncharacterized protein (TIGR03084 family)
MMQEALDFRDEVEDLLPFLRGLDAGDWNRATLFKTWTPWDVVAHLHVFDRVALLAAQDARAFAEACKKLIGQMRSGLSMADMARAELGPVSPSALLDLWHGTALSLSQELAQADPARRLPWFGPDMAARSFIGARQMETWAHAQAIYDLRGTPRQHTDRIRNIAVLGVKTFGWTFVNRGQKVPDAMPYVRLVAPSGAVWEWGEPREDACIRGDAVSFCQTVTQVRNVADTSLAVVGDVARRWMSVAQCFAGPPVDPPPPGLRAARSG